MIAAFSIAEGEEPSYEQFAHLYSMMRAKSVDQGVSLKWPITTKREVEVIERVQSKIAEEERAFRTLLNVGNLFKAGLISEAEHAIRQKEKEEEERRKMREQAGQAFRLQAVANMEMWFGMKRPINATAHIQKKYEDSRAKIVEAGKLIQDANRHAEENAAKIAELSLKLVEAERAAVDAEESRAAAEAAKEAVLRSRATEVEEAKKKAVVEYRSSEAFTMLLDKERFNADKKLNLNFLQGPPPLPERVTEEMAEAYLGEDVDADSSSGSYSSSEEEENAPPAKLLRPCPPIL
ncbi:unnamed protein product [Prunus armeniaca]